jgi:hypothetical protein
MDEMDGSGYLTRAGERVDTGRGESRRRWYGGERKSERLLRSWS